MPNSNPAKPFNLLKWFALISPAAILLIALGNGWMISNFLNNHLFQREAAISRDFVQNVLVSDDSLNYLVFPDDPALQAKFRSTVVHLTNMPDVLRTNVYSTQRYVLWSSDPELIGQRFSDNDELDDALKGELVVHSGAIDENTGKEEHIGLHPAARFFIETYIPIIRPNTHEVLGIIELYKAPVPLTEAIHEARAQVALTAVVSALALYLCLYGLIRRADRIIKEQRSQLLESETKAVIGELTTAVAHNIRNPLSSIRSSAEMIQSFPEDNSQQQAGDIVREVDRISERLTELLRLSGTAALHVETVDLAELLEHSITEHQSSFGSRSQTLALELEVDSAPVMADPNLLEQVFLSLLSNAAEAMPAGGTCVVNLAADKRAGFVVEIRDSGCGIAAQDLGQVFRPFFTTKPKGLGLGLPLAKSLLERFGGSLSLESPPGAGATVRVILPKAKTWPLS